MQRISLLLLVLVLFSATAMQAQAPAPKPNPELKKLLPLVGHWTYEGEFKPGPLGPGGKYTGEQSVRMILGGFFMEGQVTEKDASGEVRGLFAQAYDPVNKNFVFNFFLSDGTIFSAVLNISGNTWTWAGEVHPAGKQYRYRETVILAADLTSATQNAEISVDGKTWTPWCEEKWTKVQAAPKK
jgi:hypothetical protein